MAKFLVEIGVAGYQGDLQTWWNESYEIAAPEDASEATLLDLATREYERENPSNGYVATFMIVYEEVDEADPEYLTESEWAYSQSCTNNSVYFD